MVHVSSTVSRCRVVLTSLLYVGLKGAGPSDAESEDDGLPEMLQAIAGKASGFLDSVATNGRRATAPPPSGPVYIDNASTASDPHPVDDSALMGSVPHAQASHTDFVSLSEPLDTSSLLAVLSEDLVDPHAPGGVDRLDVLAFQPLTSGPHAS